MMSNQIRTASTARWASKKYRRKLSSSPEVLIFASEKILILSESEIISNLDIMHNFHVSYRLHSI
jgi:hypothetical protein